MTLEVLDKKDFDKWERLLTHFSETKLDIYFTPAYYRTWIEHENADSYCLYLKYKDIEFLYPFFKKKITGFDLDDVYYDIYTAYGYGGVISNRDNMPVDIVDKFNGEIDNWCQENKIIAEFIRESPLVSERSDFIRNAEYVIVRRNVYVKIEKNYRIPDRQAERRVKRAIKGGLRAEIDDKLLTLKDFVGLYNLATERLKMDKYYFFPSSYYENIVKFLKDSSKVINIYLNNEIIASCLFLHYADKTNYHLGASNPNFLRFAPNDLLFKTMIDYTDSLGKKILSLGGGTSTKENDSLFLFKKKFGNMIKDVYIGKKIHSNLVYSKLCFLWEQRFPGLKDKYKNHFLKYRIFP